MPFPIAQEFIERAEQALGRSLPEGFVDHLRRDNGGEIEVAGDIWQLHPIFDDSDRKRVSRTANHLLRETEEARQWKGFPHEALAIGANGSGDRLVLLPKGDEFGEDVYWWDHETAEMHAVASSFVELR